MPEPKKGPRLGSNPKHQRLLLSGLALSLFEHERVRTTEAKAKMLRPFAEKLITRAKRGSLHDRRTVLSQIEDRTVVHKLFADIAPRYADRPGGYTRILKLGQRGGDGAPMALIELVEGTAAVAEEGDAGGGRRRRLRRPARRAAAPAAESTEGPIEESSDEARGDEPVGQPGDADAATSQDEPGPEDGDSDSDTDSDSDDDSDADSDEESKTS